MIKIVKGGKNTTQKMTNFIYKKNEIDDDDDEDTVFGDDDSDEDKDDDESKGKPGGRKQVSVEVWGEGGRGGGREGGREGGRIGGRVYDLHRSLSSEEASTLQASYSPPHQPLPPLLTGCHYVLQHPQALLLFPLHYVLPPN